MSPSEAIGKKELGIGVPCALKQVAWPWDWLSPPNSQPPAGHDAVPGATSIASGRSFASLPGEGPRPHRAGCSEPALTTEWRRALTAASFLTRLPCPPWVGPDSRQLVPGMVYFPLMGVVVGTWVWLWMDALAVVFPRVLASAGAVMMGAWLTGCFHEEGLADTLDALGGQREVLRVAKDSRVGTYGLVAISVFMFAKAHTLSILPEVGLGPTLLVGHVLARWTVVPICYFVPSIESEEEDGRASYNSVATCLNDGLLSMSRVLAASACAFAIAVCGLGWSKAFTVIVAQIVLCVGLARYALHVFDGVVSGYLGATIMVSEMLTYVILAADWERFMAGGWWRVLRLLVVLGPLSLSMAGSGAPPPERPAHAGLGAPALDGSAKEQRDS